MRLAGLYALERLAQDNPAQRQTIVDLLCAYLRIPYEPPRREPARRPTARPLGTSRPLLDSPSPTAGIGAAGAARAARRHRGLDGPGDGGGAGTAGPADRAGHPVPHLRTGTKDEPVDTFWSGMSLDLTGALLGPANLIGCRITAADLTGATFTGDAWFDRARFGLNAVFTGMRFAGEASFNGTRFDHHARFDRATFNGFARFEDTDFGGRAKFERAHFCSVAMFTTATFASNAWFHQARFEDRATFDKARFTREECSATRPARPPTVTKPKPSANGPQQRLGTGRPRPYPYQRHDRLRRSTCGPRVQTRQEKEVVTLTQHVVSGTGHPLLRIPCPKRRLLTTTDAARNHHLQSTNRNRTSPQGLASRRGLLAENFRPCWSACLSTGTPCSPS